MSMTYNSDMYYDINDNTIHDNAINDIDINEIDINTVDNFSRIMNVFVADYFGLTTLPEASKK